MTEPIIGTEALIEELMRLVSVFRNGRVTLPDNYPMRGVVADAWDAAADDLSDLIARYQPGPVLDREAECAERWPEAHSGSYDPRCCRFPKSCSATVLSPAPSVHVTDEQVEAAIALAKRWLSMTPEKPRDGEGTAHDHYALGHGHAGLAILRELGVSQSEIEEAAGVVVPPEGGEKR